MTRIEVPSSPGRRRSSGRLGRWLLIALLVLVAGCAAWTWLTLNWAYAEGERAGVLQKFVRRGWICKTREGEIALYYGGGQYMGASPSPQLWDFSVRDPAIANELSNAVGHRVQLHYTEHPGIPTACFAETRFLVDRVTITDDIKSTPTPGSGASQGGAPGAGSPSAESSSPGSPAAGVSASGLPATGLPATRSHTPGSQTPGSPGVGSPVAASDVQPGSTLPAPPPPVLTSSRP